MTQPNTDELLFHWRSVIGQYEKGTWEHTFALSIQKARRRPAWEPSPAQLAIMRRMVAELYTHGQSELGDIVERVS